MATTTPGGWLSPALAELQRRIALKKANDPETILAKQRATELSAGGYTRGLGVGAMESFDPSKYLGADALKSMFDEATVTNFMPQLRALQARNASRGVRGPLAGALEGDLSSAFERNLLATTAQAGGTAAQLAWQRAAGITGAGSEQYGQGISLLGTELNLKLAREQMKAEQDAKKRAGIGAAAGAVAGGVAGSFIPGVGTALGAELGSTVGGGF